MVKESTDEKGLGEFYSDFFPKPLYVDEDKAFYDALGRRKVSIGWNPIKFVRSIKRTMKRLKKKKISGGTFKGEGVVQGGVIIFGRDGKPKYVYEEDTFNELPVADILAAVNAVKEMKE